jgi:cyclopropane fatty-acyl-phospholipid synthase-like methyltransferase
MSSETFTTYQLRRWRRRLSRASLYEHWRLDVVKTRAGIELLRNWRIDRRYGGSCGGVLPTPFEREGANGFSSADYWQLRRIFSPENGLAITPEDVLVDIGSGKGRVLNYWLDLGLGNRMVGLELTPDIAELSRQRLRPWPNVEVITGDATQLLPGDATIIYMFNPFGRRVTERLRDRIVELYEPGGPLRIVYYFAMHRSVFDDDPRFEVVPFARKAFHPGVVVRRVR